MAPESGYIQKICSLTKDIIIIFYSHGSIYSYQNNVLDRVSFHDDEWIDIECADKVATVITDNNVYKFSYHNNQIQHSSIYDSNDIAIKDGKINKNEIVILKKNDKLFEYLNGKFINIEMPNYTGSVLDPEIMVSDKHTFL